MVLAVLYLFYQYVKSWLHCMSLKIVFLLFLSKTFFYNFGNITPDELFDKIVKFEVFKWSSCEREKLF